MENFECPNCGYSSNEHVNGSSGTVIYPMIKCFIDGHEVNLLSCNIIPKYSYIINLDKIDINNNSHKAEIRLELCSDAKYKRKTIHNLELIEENRNNYFKFKIIDYFIKQREGFIFAEIVGELLDWRRDL